GVMDVVQKEVADNIPKKKERAAAVNDLYVPENGYQPEKKRGSEKEIGQHLYQVRLPIEPWRRMFITGDRLPAEKRTQPASEHRAEGYRGAYQCHEKEGTDKTSPKIARPRDRVGEIILFGVVLEIAVERRPHDGGADQHQEKGYGGFEIGQRGRRIYVFFIV